MVFDDAEGGACIRELAVELVDVHAVDGWVDRIFEFVLQFEEADGCYSAFED